MPPRRSDVSRDQASGTSSVTRRSDVSRDHGATGSRLTSLLLVLVVSCGLLYLAYPRLHASLLYLPVDTAINNYYKTRETPAGQLEGLQQRAQDSIEIYPHHRYREGLSLLYFLQAADMDKPLYVRRQAFEHSIAAAEASLDRAPAQPRAWLRVAQARAWLRYPPDEVIAAFKMAVYTGRVEPSMFMARLVLGLSYLPRMDAEGVAMMRDQVLLAWQFQRRQVIRAIRNKEIRMAPLEQLLAGAHDGILEEIRNGAVR